MGFILRSVIEASDFDTHPLIRHRQESGVIGPDKISLNDVARRLFNRDSSAAVAADDIPSRCLRAAEDVVVSAITEPHSDAIGDGGHPRRIRTDIVSGNRILRCRREDDRDSNTCITADRVASSGSRTANQVVSVRN